MDYQRWSTLGYAVLASLVVHSFLLVWPVRSPTLTSLDFGNAAFTRLRVSLKLHEASVEPATEKSVSASPELVPSAVAPKSDTKETKKEPGVTQPSQDTAKAATQPSEPAALAGYYPVAKLSRMPEAISEFDIKAPAGGDSGLGGKMTIRVWISAKGEIDQLRVMKSELPPDYAEAALAAFGKLRFDAGEINGMRVNSWADIVIEYADFKHDPAQAAEARRRKNEF